MVSSIFGTPRESLPRRSKKRQRRDRSLSPDDSAAWSSEEREEGSLLSHKRQQNRKKFVQGLEEELKAKDDQLQDHENHIDAQDLRIAELEKRSDLLKSQLETAKNHTFLLQGVNRDAVPPGVIADASHCLI